MLRSAAKLSADSQNATFSEYEKAFESMKDVWELFRVVLDERKRREIDPTLAMLRECIAEAGQDISSEEMQRLERVLGEIILRDPEYAAEAEKRARLADTMIAGSDRSVSAIAAGELPRVRL